jgi:hypothetical protein
MKIKACRMGGGLEKEFNDFKQFLLSNHKAYLRPSGLVLTAGVSQLYRYLCSILIQTLQQRTSLTHGLARHVATLDTLA